MTTYHGLCVKLVAYRPHQRLNYKKPNQVEAEHIPETFEDYDKKFNKNGKLGHDIAICRMNIYFGKERSWYILINR